MIANKTTLHKKSNDTESNNGLKEGRNIPKGQSNS